MVLLTNIVSDFHYFFSDYMSLSEIKVARRKWMVGVINQQNSQSLFEIITATILNNYLDISFKKQSRFIKINWRRCWSIVWF